MIIEKQPLPDDPTHPDAPPSYDDVRGYFPEKRRLDDQPVASSSSSTPLRSPALPTSPSSASSVRDKGKGRANNWFNFAAARTTREVRTTVLGLVRDLIQEQMSNSPAATGILQSCSDACTAHQVSFSELLQEKSIEEHTPLYWAIVKRLPDHHHEVEETQGPDLISALISYASPLNPETIREVRLACLATSDQKLFQRLRMSPEFSAISGVDQMLLGVTIPPDDIEVEDVSADGGAFAATFVIPHFHKRMVVSKKIELDFIARSRLWRLSFFVAGEHRYHYDPPTGSWCISLALLENSPPTYIDSQVVIPIAQANSPPTSPPQSPPPSRTRSPVAAHKRKSSDLKPTISLRLSSNDQLESPGKYDGGKKIIVGLDNSLMGAKLQYANNPYVGSDEKLRARFEARLGKPRPADQECVIC